MTREESIAEANRILGDAGWTPGDQWSGKFVFRDTLIVGGIAPDGTGYVKNPEAVLEGHPLYGDPAYPDEPHEAAQWLVDTYGAKPKFRFRRKPVVLSTEATLEPLAAAIELAEDSAHESNGETGEGSGVASQGDDSTDAGDAERVDLFDADPGSAGSGVVRGEGEAWEPNAEHSPDDAIVDAIFEDAPDLGSELLDDEAFAVPELEAPPPEDFAPDEIEPEPEHAAGAFIFGDNLAHDRIIRIGQLSEHANTLIDAAKVGYSDAEHDAVRSHVVTHMNEAGAYVGGNQALFDRFIELESLTARVRRIEIYRDQRQDFIRSADREAVASFEPETGWP
jgi:hypothetical protein